LTGFGIKPVCGIEKMGRLILIAKNFDNSLFLSVVRGRGNKGVFKDGVLAGTDLTLFQEGIVMFRRYGNHYLHSSKLNHNREMSIQDFSFTPSGSIWLVLQEFLLTRHAYRKTLCCSGWKNLNESQTPPRDPPIRSRLKFPSTAVPKIPA